MANGSICTITHKLLFNANLWMPYMVESEDNPLLQVVKVISPHIFKEGCVNLCYSNIKNFYEQVKDWDNHVTDNALKILQGVQLYLHHYFFECIRNKKNTFCLENEMSWLKYEIQMGETNGRIVRSEIPKIVTDYLSSRFDNVPSSDYKPFNDTIRKII